VPAEPSVGVVIAAWNAERWLAQALDSVLAQEHMPVDVLVIDDGSSDATGELARRYPPPVRVIGQANAGIGAARNRGVEQVSGDAVAFLDADDLMTPASIACRVRVLSSRPEIDLVFGTVRRFSLLVDGVPVAQNEPQPAHLPGAMLVRRTALAAVGPFPVQAHVAEGLDWLLRARELALGEVTVPEQVVWRRVHGENNSLRHREQIGEFAHALKASLDRRRAAAQDAAGGER
jgi:glycosyltransferase involved in cell wall biosynthesis